MKTQKTARRIGSASPGEKKHSEMLMDGAMSDDMMMDGVMSDDMMMDEEFAVDMETEFVEEME